MQILSPGFGSFTNLLLTLVAVTDNMAVRIYLGYPLLPKYCYLLYRASSLSGGDEN
jgi:hypothetical protein